MQGEKNQWCEDMAALRGKVSALEAQVQSAQVSLKKETDGNQRNMPEGHRHIISDQAGISLSICLDAGSKLCSCLSCAFLPWQGCRSEC